VGAGADAAQFFVFSRQTQVVALPEHRDVCVGQTFLFASLYRGPEWQTGMLAPRRYRDRRPMPPVRINPRMPAQSAVDEKQFIQFTHGEQQRK
jgi:hypothetical protein